MGDLSYLSDLRNLSNKIMLEIIIFLFIFLSRAAFLSISPSFFDSLEYINLFNSPSLVEALKSVHYPIHPLWITIGWLVNKIPISTTLFKIEFLNAILGTICCFLIYKIAKEFTNKSKALLITLICSFLPYFWLSQTNILYEPLLGVFLLGAFYYLIKGNKGNKGKIILAGVCFAGAFLVSSTSPIYLIFMAGVLLKKRDLRGLGVLGGGLLFGLLGYLRILILREIPVREIFSVLSSSNNFLVKIQTEGFLFFLRGIRNSIIVYFNYLTIPVGLYLGYLGILSYLRKQGMEIIIFWLISFFLLNSIWHVGMFGRLSLYLIIVPVFLLIKVKDLRIIKLVFLFIFVTSAFKVIPYHLRSVPDIVEQEYFSQVSGKPSVIISNYEEPFLKEELEDFRIFNSPKTDIEEIKKWLREKLINGQTVLITSQALSTPYWQYDGMNYQILSKKRNNLVTDGREIISNYKLENLVEFNKNLKIYRIINQSPQFAFY